MPEPSPAANDPPDRPFRSKSRAGTRAEEVRLAEEYHDRIRFFATSWVGSEEAVDVAQETLRRVFVALREGRIRDPDNPAAFIFQTARHVCLHLQRSESRRKRALARESPTYRPSPDALDRLVSTESRSRVAEAMHRLSGEDQEVLRLFYFDGFDTSEVASELELTAGAVRVRKHRALQRLRSAMPSPATPLGAGASQ